MDIKDVKIPLADLLFMAIYYNDTELIKYAVGEDPHALIADVTPELDIWLRAGGNTPSPFLLVVRSYNVKAFKECIDAIDFSHGDCVSYLSDFLIGIVEWGGPYAMMAYGMLGYIAVKLTHDHDLLEVFLGDYEEVNWYNPNGGTCSADSTISDAMCANNGSKLVDGGLGWFFLDGLESLYGVRPSTTWESIHPKPKEDTI